MRGQHIVAVQRQEQGARVVRETGQGVGVHHKRRTGARQGEQIPHGPLPHPGRWSNHHGVGVLRADLQVDLVFERRQHHCLQVGGVDRQGVGW